MYHPVIQCLVFAGMCYEYSMRITRLVGSFGWSVTDHGRVVQSISETAPLQHEPRHLPLRFPCYSTCGRVLSYFYRSSFHVNLGRFNRGEKGVEHADEGGWASRIEVGRFQCAVLSVRSQSTTPYDALVREGRRSIAYLKLRCLPHYSGRAPIGESVYGEATETGRPSKRSWWRSTPSTPPHVRSSYECLCPSTAYRAQSSL